jgi:hypothetical protein
MDRGMWCGRRAVTNRRKSLIIGQREKLWPPAIRNMVNLSFSRKDPRPCEDAGSALAVSSLSLPETASARASPASRFPHFGRHQACHSQSERGHGCRPGKETGFPSPELASDDEAGVPDLNSTPTPSHAPVRHCAERMYIWRTLNDAVLLQRQTHPGGLWPCTNFGTFLAMVASPISLVLPPPRIGLT